MGKVISSKKVKDKDGFIQGTFYKVRVDEILKGSPPREVGIYDENSSGRFPMTVDTQYLLFAYEGTFEGLTGLHLAISSSGNSGMLTQTNKTLEEVRKLGKAQQGASPCENSRWI
ncbi:hypothetical protein GC207_00065 [bacterium]|nr:hypothetical protein [bacterium]